MPRRNRKDYKQGQISRLQGDKTQQKPSREVYSGPGAGIRGDTEGAFFCPEEALSVGQKGGRKAAEGGTVVARANLRLDEAQGYGLGVARDHLQTRPRGQGQRR